MTLQYTSLITPHYTRLQLQLQLHDCNYIYTTLYYTPLRYTNYTTLQLQQLQLQLHYTNYTALITLRYTTLHYITLH